MTKEENWVKEFDERKIGYVGSSTDFNPDEIKAFIQSTLDNSLREQKSRIVEALEKLRNVRVDCDIDECQGQCKSYYDIGLDEAINIIKDI